MVFSANSDNHKRLSVCVFRFILYLAVKIYVFLYIFAVAPYPGSVDRNTSGRSGSTGTMRVAPPTQGVRIETG